MIWQIDNATQVAARTFPLPIYALQPRPQQLGYNFDPAKWQKRLRPGDVFPPGLSRSDPAQIIAEFAAQHYLQGLALTVSWGGMGRTIPEIYRYPPQNIHNTLDQCAQSIPRTNSIQQSWDLLTNGLQWTSVITSKTLHFLCRALGLSQDPPVPIDGAVILKNVWPGFRIGIPPALRPGDWEGKTFAAYCRYMTAILEWGRMKQPTWTTSEVEATIFDENQ